MEITSIEDLKSVCRSCLDCTTDSVSLWDMIQVDEIGEPKQLAEMLMECTSVTVTKNDVSSQIICTDCVPILTSAYNFKYRSVQSEQCLQNILKAFEEDLEPTKLIESETKPLQTDKENILPKEQDEEVDDPNESEDGDKKIRCSLCADSFDKKPNYLDHFQNHIAAAKYFDFNVEDQGFTCFACNEKNIEFETDLNDHLHNHSNYSCRSCKETFLELTSLKQHITIHGVGWYMCQHCVVTFNRKDQILSHLKNHRLSNPKPTYNCPICNSKYQDRVDLKAHIKLHSEQLKTCNFCNQTFSNNLNLQRHKSETHSKNLCSICGKTFPRTLAQHMKTVHSTERFHECEVCHKKFRMRYTLLQHRRIHNSFKPFGCKFCSYRSHTRKDTIMHERTHTNEKPYKCKYEGCDASFRTASHQNQHYRLHTGERKHACKLCDKRFREASKLKTHLLVHDDVKHHKCDVCEKRFRQKSQLRYHKLNVHADELIKFEYK